MTRRHSSFPVSQPQGAANWETAPDLLIPNGLLFPSTLGEKEASRKLKSGSSAVNSSAPNATNPPAPAMSIQRRYQPAASALDDLVEVLCQLLSDTVGDNDQSAISSVSAPRREGACAEGVT